MRIPLFFALVGTLCSVSLAHADAPTETPQLQPQTQVHKTFQVSIKNVKASLMAWWLDPTHHEPPLGLSAPPRPQPAQGELPQAKGLPDGIDRIVAVDPQNALLVFGSFEGARQLADTIRFLDRPLRQIEIEAQFFQIDADSIEKVKLQSNLPQTQQGFVRAGNNVNTTLQMLLAEKKAVVLSAPRVTAINNASSDLGYKTQLPTKLQVSGKNIAEGSGLTLANRHSLRVTPTINHDETVTLVVDGEQCAELQGMTTTGTLVIERLTFPEIVANLRDGETIIIEEKQLQQSNAPYRSKAKNFIFLTPRIIRRTGDELTQ